MKTFIAVAALCAMSGLAVADELEDSYAALKAAEQKKDADGVKKNAATVSKLARAVASAPQPAGTEAEAWKEHVDYAKQVDTYTEYSLATTAAAGVDSAKAVELVDQLIAQNPKSKYLGSAMSAYVNGLNNLAASLSGKSPDRALVYANKLIALKSRPAPEGVAEADWEKVKAAALGSGYYNAGAVHGQKQAWSDCDRDMKEALPYINKDQTRLGVAYFYLGLCEYQFGRLTADRAMMMSAQRFSDQSASIPGPMQAQARQNAYAIKTELATPARR